MDTQTTIATLDGIALTISQLGIPEVSVGAGIADALIKVIGAAINKHQQITGEPLDLTKLEWIEPV